MIRERMNMANQKERKTLIQLTEEICKITETNADDIVSVGLVYRHKTDNGNKRKPFTIKGLNIQYYGHKLIIVPDVREPNTYMVYNTSEKSARKDIANDLVNTRKFTHEDAAKLMKCSQGSIAHLLGEDK
jgi:hypothetical protein